MQFRQRLTPNRGIGTGKLMVLDANGLSRPHNALQPLLISHTLFMLGVRGL